MSRTGIGKLEGMEKFRFMSLVRQAIVCAMAIGIGLVSVRLNSQRVVPLDALNSLNDEVPVSYTHLTLPTMMSV